MRNDTARTNPVRTALLSGGTAWGVMAFEFFTPGLPFVLAAAGADFVILDMEHSGISIETVKAQVAFAKAAGIVPMVRVPGHGYAQVAPVLDAGAMGIMLPMTETRQEAEAFVSWCRYRPQGRRGLGFGVGHDDWRGRDAAETMRAANESVLTIALIESERGVANAHEILGVKGIDIGWLGHFDLSDSLGIAGQFSHPRYVEAEERLIAAAAAAGKPLGWVAADAAAARHALSRGFRCLCIGHEVAVLRSALAAELAAARQPGGGGG
ncbi:HpcH/HpaI aldolase family protein [Elioraea rosea]|uniref:HpcH/HpaI aldolase family protein n=1 Tax=Elioraea rosea TaxID=2492390 RepID=UPI0013159A44|nr:aldolase/citrate lyase family protein [Elioraea rosea]